MRHLLILACLAFGTGVVADEADFDFKSKKANIAIEKYEATIKKAKAVEKRNRVDLILALEAALKYERTEGELDEAIKIRDAIKALKKRAERTTKVAYYDNGQKAWEVHYKDGKKDGLETKWDENGKKKLEAQYKDGKEVSRKEF